MFEFRRCCVFVFAGHDPAIHQKQGDLSFRGASKTRTRNLEIPGSMLRIAPE